jgi:hypothetical protein
MNTLLSSKTLLSRTFSLGKKMFTDVKDWTLSCDFYRQTGVNNTAMSDEFDF